MRILEGPAGERHHEATPAFQLDVVRSVRLHPKLAASVACIVLVLTVGYALTRKPMYEARSLSYVEPLETKVVSDGSGGIYDPARYDSYFQQQIQTATRQDILEAAIAKMPADMWQQPGEDPHQAADRLASALKVERVGSSYQLAISMQSDNPEKASVIVNAATNAYLEQGRKDENARSDGRLVLLQEESQRIQKELQQDRDEQAELSNVLGIADPQNGGANPYDLQLTGVRTELVAAREAHDVAAAQLSSVTARGALSSAGMKAIADEAIAGDTGLSALKTTINERRAVLNAQMASLTPTNPVYKQDADEIASMDKQVEARSTQLRENAEHRVEDRLRLDLQRTGDVEARLNGELAHATAQAGTAAPKLQRAKDLAADITRLQARYSTVDDALRGLQLESSGPGTAHLLLAANVPDAPAANRRMLLLGLALPLAAFMGILAAVLARKSDRRLRSAMDLEQAVGLPPVCAIPANFSYYDSSQNEHLLRLATALERGHRLSGARMFVFTAASEPMDTTGLVHGVQEKLSELGFKAVVLGAEDLRETTAAERKQGQHVSQIEQMKRDNAFVLIDARPLLHSADTEYAVSCADATMVVAESSLTTGVELKRCMLLLQQLKATGVGTILLNVTEAGDQNVARRPLTIVEQEPRVPVWERTRGMIPPVKIAEPVKMVEEPVFKPAPSVVKEELPKRVQLVPAVTEAVKPVSRPHYEEPFLLFEEAAVGATSKQAVREEVVEPVQPVTAQRVAEPVVEKTYEAPVAAKMEVPTIVKEVKAIETPEEKIERMKREAIARVKARFGMPEEAVEALSLAMAKPIAKTTPGFAPQVAFRPAGGGALKPAFEQVVPAVAATPVSMESGEVTIFQWEEPASTASEAVALRPVQEEIVQQPTEPQVQLAETVMRPPVAQSVVKQQSSAVYSDLPPVRRVTVPQERVQTTSVPVVPWAPRVERRKVPREPIVFPRGLNKAALRMQEKGQAIAKGQAGPSLTAAEQAIANKISSAHQPVAKPVTPQAEKSTEQGGRWSLLRRFGGFETEEQSEPGDHSLGERAAG